MLPGLWLGLLLAVALVATPTAFALLAHADAGRLVARVLAIEAHASLAFAALLLVLERLAAKRISGASKGSQFSAGMGLAGIALFCTAAGYFAVLPSMEAARAGQGRLSFGQLHAISAVFFLIKLVAVTALAWRATAGIKPAASS